MITSPHDIARRTLKLLATRRITPTPDNYREIYAEVSGVTTQDPIRTRNGAQAASCDARADATLELLAEMLELGVAMRFFAHPEAASEAAALAQQLRSPVAPATPALRAQLKALWLKADARGAGRHEAHEGLLRLLRLLVDNVGELVMDDQWLREQLAAVHQAIARPLDRTAIDEAERCLQNVVFKRSLLKQGVIEARNLLKQMVGSFIEQLGQLSESTGDYHDTMESLAQQLRQTDDIERLKDLIDEVMRETRAVQATTRRAREEILSAREQVEVAETRVRSLESDLAEAAARAREDHLTGTLNRQGLAEAFEREQAAARRRGQPLSVALLDIDNLQDLTDTHGHKAGDDALAHLAGVVKETARPSDVVARYRGEQFLLLLPNSSPAQAVEVTVRLQRELTRRFFLHDNNRVLVTFSAGVAGCDPHEAQDPVVMRAEHALQQARRAGRHQVVAAD